VYSYFAIRMFFAEFCDRGGIDFALFDSSVDGSLADAIGGGTTRCWALGARHVICTHFEPSFLDGIL